MSGTEKDVQAPQSGPRKRRRRRPVPNSELTVVRRIAAEPMSMDEWLAADRLLARFVAHAFIRDHPELFPSKHQGAAPDSRLEPGAKTP